MKYEEYYITDKNNKSNCVIRTFVKMFNQEYDDVANELASIATELNCSFNDIETFEEYMNRRNFYKMDFSEDIQIKDLKLTNDKYIIFCYNKEEFYHMIPIINNTIYDRTNECLDLYVISIYTNEQKR